MSITNWRESVIGQAAVKNKPEALKSWWAEKSCQESREEFQRRLVEDELTRIVRSQKFGGHKMLYDKSELEPK